MPADFFIDVPLATVFSKAMGQFGLSEAQDHMDRLLRHPDFRPEFRQLSDFREITKVTLTHPEISQLAARRIFSNTSKRAFVVSNNVQFGLSRMFGTLRAFEGETGIHVFRDMDKALAWLSLSAAPAASAFTRLGTNDLPARA